MFRRVAFALASLSSVCGSSHAQERPIDPAPYISDLNLIAGRVNRQNLLNGDVAIIAGAACASMRQATRDSVAAKMSAFLEKYPDSEALQNISQDEFISYEVTAFKQFGASRETAIYVEDTIKASPMIPSSRPSKAESLANSIVQMELRSCELRERISNELSAPAPPKQASTAKLLGKGVLGLGAMVVDVAVAAKAPYLFVAVLSAGSAGWGWNRIEEVYFDLQKEDK